MINHPDFEKYDLSHVKMAGSGPHRFLWRLLKKLVNTFGVEYISEGYGLTECTMGATMTPPAQPEPG